MSITVSSTVDSPPQEVKTTAAKIDAMMLTDLIYQKFYKLLIDNEDTELTNSQINEAKLFSIEIKNRIHNK